MAINNLGTAASFATRNNPTFTGTVNWSGAVLNTNAATIATSNTTTSTSFTDLATVGPSVTLTTGTKVLVILTSRTANDTDSGSTSMSFAVSGASTVAASSTRSFEWQKAGGLVPQIKASAAFMLTGLTAGSNTFTAKYLAGAGTGYWYDRSVIVIDLGS